jgi:hypothetical protein
MMQSIEVVRYTKLAKALLRDHSVIQPTWKKGFGSSGLYTRDKLFAFLSHRNRLVLKLPRERVNELVARREVTRWDPRGDGRGLREWAAVRPSSRIKWLPLAREAMKFVASQSQGALKKNGF